MTTTGIKHGRNEYTITCAQCLKEQTILTRAPAADWVEAHGGIDELDKRLGALGVEV